MILLRLGRLSFPQELKAVVILILNYNLEAD
jgi:hypothetical protein